VRSSSASSFVHELPSRLDRIDADRAVFSLPSLSPLSEPRISTSPGRRPYTPSSKDKRLRTCSSSLLLFPLPSFETPYPELTPFSPSPPSPLLQTQSRLRRRSYPRRFLRRVRRSFFHLNLLLLRPSLHLGSRPSTERARRHHEPVRGSVDEPSSNDNTSTAAVVDRRRRRIRSTPAAAAGETYRFPSRSSSCSAERRGRSAGLPLMMFFPFYSYESYYVVSWQFRYSIFLFSSILSC